MAKRSASKRKPRAELITTDWPALNVEMRSVSALTPYISNPRTHSKEQIALIANAIKEWGWTTPVLIDENGMVIAGHGRLLAAEQLQIDQVPVVVARGWTEAQRRGYVIADNQIALEAGWDRDLLSKELADLQGLEFNLALTGFDTMALKPLLRGPATAPDVIPDVPEEKEVVSKPGDLWILGEHRLLCGDSTKTEDLDRLMAGEAAVLLATDPPHLVDYDGANHPMSYYTKAGAKTGSRAGREIGRTVSVRTIQRRIGNKHWDGYIDPESSVEFYAGFLANALRHCVERVPVYQWHNTKQQSSIEKAWEKNGLFVHQTIIWVKPRAVLTRSHYLWQHEPCFYGWATGKMPIKSRRPVTTATTVWPIDQADEPKGLHPTIKPLEIFAKPIEFHTKAGEVCLEPFSGSGTQIAAAERLARRCFAMELSPAFVDVGVIRWQGISGQQATLDGDGRTFEEIKAARKGGAPKRRRKAS